MYAIEARGLAKAYGGRRVVNGFSMQVHKGDIYGFVGKNGAGKSTVMKMVTCLVAPTEGEVLVFGQPAWQGAPGVAESRVGALIESPGILGELSAYDNMMVKALALGIPDAKERSQEILRWVGLSAAGKKRAKGFSQGMKQRLGIGLALLGSPDLLLLDEPFNGLDPEGTRDLRQLIMRLNESFGVTVVVSSHVLEQLDRMVTRYGVIADGRMVREMTAEEVRQTCGDSLAVRTTQPDVTLAQLEQRFPDCRFLMEPDGTIRISGPFEATAVAQALRVMDATVLELTETRRDIEEFFVELMEGGERHV